ncbi:hypothetical protein ACFYKX_16200 [Cytobacillus sp. FJAT-54145]|uniref:Group-specific protein n=1 Tax=Cytobacillus spartinae TaxID=3299023 RepID=A0ABW6KD02_9BACI
MFDPTAFENMRVVMEGALYDQDLNGEIRIIDRNDLINTAKMSRAYEITLSLPEGSDKNTCTFLMEAKLENLAAELLPPVHSEALSGCHVSITFNISHQAIEGIQHTINEIIKEVWGEERQFEQKIVVDPFSQNDLVTTEVKVQFNRLVYEDHIDDLVHMVEYMILTLQRLKNI